MNEVKIIASDYGLDDSKTKGIEEAFSPKIIERDELKTIYKEIIKKELSSETCSEAKELRLKLVKVRTGIADVHRSQKSFFLNAGKYVDAWKNKETLPVQQMEEKLKEIEGYFAKIESEIIEKIHNERLVELNKYRGENDYLPENLGMLDDEMWSNFLIGAKSGFETRQAAEKKAESDRIENERLDQLESDRIAETSPYAFYKDDLDEVISLRDQTEADYKIYFDQLKGRKEADDESKKAQIIENERLKKEAEEKEKLRLKNEKIAEDLLEKERLKREKIKAKEDELNEAKLKKETEAREKAEEELRLQKEAEEKAESDRIAAEQERLKRGDSGKIDDLKSDLIKLKTSRSFKSVKYQKKYAGAGELIDKIVNYLD